MYLPERLTAEHSVADFHCGIDELDEWIQHFALHSQAKGVSTTDVWSHDGLVVGYYTVSPTAVAAAGLPRSATTGLDLIPAYLIGRLALDRLLQGKGNGERLLVHALTRVARAAEHGGGRLVIVDAIDSRALTFYQHFGFTQVPGTSRLYLKISTARRYLDRGSRID